MAGNTKDFIVKNGLVVSNSLLTACTTTNTISTFGNVSIGNSTVNTNISSSIVKIANSTSSISINIPSATATSNGFYFLNANGSYIPTPAYGTNTQVQFNDSGLFNGSGALTFNKSTNTLFSANISSNSANIINLISNNITSNSGTVNNFISSNIVSSFANIVSINLNTVTANTANLIVINSTSILANGSINTANAIIGVANVTTLNVTNTISNTVNANIISSNNISTGSIIANTIWSIGQDANNANIRIISGNYGVILRNDGANMYLLQTANGSPNSSYNTYRPFSWSLSTGAVVIDSTGLGASFGGGIFVNGSLNFQTNSASITWPYGPSIYQDTSGNGPGDIVMKTYDGTTYHYNIFLKNGNLSIANNLIVSGGTIANINYINDIGGVNRIVIPNAGTSTYITGTGNNGWQHQFKNSGGTVAWLMGGSNSDTAFYCTGNIAAYWSDIRLKEYIENVNTTSLLDNVLNYRLVDFGWNSIGRSFNGKAEGERERGLIAQEVQKINPEAVVENKIQLDENGNPYLTINHNKLIFDLIGAIQEQQKHIIKLENIINHIIMRNE